MAKKKKEEQMIFTSPDGGETVCGEPLGGKGPKVLISKSNKATIEEECQNRQFFVTERAVAM